MKIPAIVSKHGLIFKLLLIDLKLSDCIQLNDAAGKDIKLMESGLITKEFDRRITTQPKLYYLDEN